MYYILENNHCSFLNKLDKLENILLSNINYTKFNNLINKNEKVLYFIYLYNNLKDCLGKEVILDSDILLFNKIFKNLDYNILNNYNSTLVLYNFVETNINNKNNTNFNLNIIKKYFKINSNIIISCCESKLEQLSNSHLNNKLDINYINIDWQLYNCIYNISNNYFFEKKTNFTSNKRFIFLNRNYCMYRYILLINIFNKNIKNLFHLSFLCGRWVENGQIKTDLNILKNEYIKIINYILHNKINITYTENTYNNIKSNIPIIIDSSVDKCNWIITNENDKINSIFSDRCIYIAVETFIHKNSNIQLYLSEKTYKALYYKTPFILYGQQYILKYLKSVGLKTYSPYINEDYDNEENDALRLNKIINEINRLSTLSDKIYKNLYNSMQIIANENFELLKNNFNNSIYFKYSYEYNL
jgi:hypothetical protein